MKQETNVLISLLDDLESTSSHKEENRPLRDVLRWYRRHNSWLSPLHTHHHSKFLLFMSNHVQ